MAETGEKIGRRSQREPPGSDRPALCHGWIDGQLGAYDADWWLVRFTPRKPGSKWSQKNRDRALALIAGKRMAPAGLREIAQAKADGRWESAYVPQSTAAVPDDLAAALARNSKASSLFDALDSANRYSVLYRVQTAKKPELRVQRIATFVAMLARGETIHLRKARKT
nr:MULTISPECIES: YdeI/OmpD-associated family protein [unclassified Bradyrhizobium]